MIESVEMMRIKFVLQRKLIWPGIEFSTGKQSYNNDYVNNKN